MKTSPHFKRAATLPCDQNLHQPHPSQRQIMRACTEDIVAVVDELVLSQEDQLQIYRSTHQITQCAVVCIIFHRDLRLKRCC